MIQRKQSLYLVLAGLLMAVSTWLANLWKVAKSWVQADDYYILYGAFLLSVILSFGVIFLYKNRKWQIILNNLNIFLNILLVGYLIYCLSNLPGGLQGSEKGIGLFVPVITIFLLVMANRFIKKDEKLVKSVDRFR